MRTTTARTTAVSIVTALAVLGTAATSQAAPLLNGQSIKSGSISATKIKKNTLTGLQIKESTLGMVPLANFAKQADTAKTAQTAVQAQSADTAKVADDAKALNGRDHTKFLSNSVRYVSAQANPVPGPAGGMPSEVTASCAADEKAIGGGGAWIITGFQDGNQPTALDAPLTASMPVPAAPTADGLMTGWRVLGRNFSGTERTLRAYAICVPKTA